MDATGAVRGFVRGTDPRLARVVAAALAALAESGIVFLPVMELTREAVGAADGPLLTFALFLPLFVAGVAIGSALQRFRLYTWFVALAALGVGLAEGLAWGSRDAPGTVFVVVLALLVALRVVTLAVRDWRDPVRGSFGWGAVAVLLEVALQGGAAPAWRSLMPVVVALFFAGSLASRGVSVLAVDRVGERADGSDRARWLMPTLAIAGFGAVLAVAVSLGRPHGLFEAVGGLAGGAVLAILTALAFLTAKILLGPVAWLFERIHLSLDPIRSLAQRLSHLTVRPEAGPQHALGLEWLERVLGLLVLTAAALVLMRMIHRRWPRVVSRRGAASDGSQSPVVEPPAAPGLRDRRSRSHRELPADTVRRWYAEALLALERRGLAKPPAATPAEFLEGVQRAFPGCRTQFMALTRAYEDVRYGSLGVERSVMQGLEEGRTTLMETLRRMSRADVPDEPAGDP